MIVMSARDYDELHARCDEVVGVTATGLNFITTR